VTRQKAAAGLLCFVIEFVFVAVSQTGNTGATTIQSKLIMRKHLKMTADEDRNWNLYRSWLMPYE